MDQIANSLGLIKIGKINDEEKKIVKERYGKCETLTLMRILRRSARSICRIAKIVGVHSAKATVSQLCEKYPKKLRGVWHSMLSRCKNPQNSSYKNYGGRGISVCSEWCARHVFSEWAVTNGYEEGLTLDRIDVNGDYCPENCRWITPELQYLNRTDNTVITAWGETKTLKEWTQDSRCAVHRITIMQRIRNGLDPEFAISFPPTLNKILISVHGETKTVKDWSRDPRSIYTYKHLLKKIKNGEDPRTLIIDCVEQNENPPHDSDLQTTAPTKPTTQNNLSKTS